MYDTANGNTLVLYVLRQKRKYFHDQMWVPVCLFDREGYYRGPAVFETKQEAKEYMKIYNDKMQQRRAASAHHNKHNMQELLLKIFCEDKLPIIGIPYKRVVSPVKPDLLKTAQGLFEVLQDYIRLKRQEMGHEITASKF